MRCCIWLTAFWIRHLKVAAKSKENFRVCEKQTKKRYDHHGFVRIVREKGGRFQYNGGRTCALRDLIFSEKI